MFVLATSRPALRRARLFDEGFERFVSAAVPAPAVSRPALDVVEADDAYTVTVDLPGVTKDALQISVDGRRVRIEADVTRPAAAPAAAAQAATGQAATEQVATACAATAIDALADAEAKPDAPAHTSADSPAVASPAAATLLAAAPRVLYSERRATRFARSIVLPSEADDSRASAKLVDGVLTLVLPKKAQPQPARIEVS